MENKKVFINGGFSFLCIVWLIGLLSGCATTKSMMSKHPPSPIQSKSMEENCGIKIIGPRLTAEGYMIDFIYAVIDPEKAAPLFDREVKPYLIDHESGGQAQEFPKTGFLRTTNKPRAGEIYYMFFVNPDKVIKKGSKVSVVIGDFKTEDLILE